MWYDLGKHGKINMEYLERIIKEAKMVGKTSWYASEQF